MSAELDLREVEISDGGHVRRLLGMPVNCTFGGNLLIRVP